MRDVAKWCEISREITLGRQRAIRNASVRRDATAVAMDGCVADGLSEHRSGVAWTDHEPTPFPCHPSKLPNNSNFNFKKVFEEEIF